MDAGRGNTVAANLPASPAAATILGFAYRSLLFGAGFPSGFANLSIRVRIPPLATRRRAAISVQLALRRGKTAPEILAPEAYPAGFCCGMRPVRKCS